MSKMDQKRDRTARLLRLQILLWQNPAGLETGEIARKCLTSKRTAYRDLKALETELKVPIWEQGSKRGIAEGYFLPPIAFTEAEAVNIFLAVRKLQNFAPLCNSSLSSTFMKLNTIVPSILKKQIQNTIDHLERQPRDEKKINNFDKLIQAWLSGHRVTIRYQELYGPKPLTCTIEPYFIEPSARNRANYVIAYCCEKKSICTFIIDRILGEVTIEAETFEIPKDFNIDQYLASAWGAFADQKVEVIKLRFSKRISLAIKETSFHPSQVTELKNDGSLLMTLKVNNTGDFHAWIMSWGKDVEVLEPEAVRNQMMDVIRTQAILYGIKLEPTQEERDKGDLLASSSTEITDSQWTRIASILPSQPLTGRHRADDRRIINGILCALKSNTKWCKIPRKYGPYSTCFMRLKAWKKQGVWEKIEEIISNTE
jgi:predicted DNA-binding transcriptional regulator YafY